MDIHFRGMRVIRPSACAKITFNATGKLGSTTGIPTCHFEATIDGDQMDLKMTVTRNPGGPLSAGVVYDYKGKKEPK